ncbi:interferon phi 1 isoform X2 [Denticeps clupeoides]|uniref:interferon phi 1 isoform X2 n=1 Tax=Denticeps clupeoides TaxID=299321 RepID=UPI0010A4FE23|nr:uncharacterized protein LOC114794712 isoform X2 [Denticeps clupeoides]
MYISNGRRKSQVLREGRFRISGRGRCHEGGQFSTESLLIHTNLYMAAHNATYEEKVEFLYESSCQILHLFRTNQKAASGMWNNTELNNFLEVLYRQSSSLKEFVKKNVSHEEEGETIFQEADGTHSEQERMGAHEESGEGSSANPGPSGQAYAKRQLIEHCQAWAGLGPCRRDLTLQLSWET